MKSGKLVFSGKSISRKSAWLQTGGFIDKVQTGLIQGNGIVGNSHTQIRTDGSIGKSRAITPG
jgi:hypothetical protein